MSGPEPRRVPTLTEVVPASADGEAAPRASTAATQPDRGALTQRVLADVQQRVDLMLEYRLRETLGPALARLGDTLIREMQVELAATLRDVVAEAVEQELARGPSPDG
jgi:hypothetical protein